MRTSWLIGAGVIASIAAACSGPDFQSANGGSSAGAAGSNGKGSGGSSSGGSSSGGSGVSGSSTAGGPNPGTGGSQGEAGGNTAGGGPPMCTEASECASSSSPCVITYCDPMLGCIEEPAPDGPVPDDVPGDCRYLSCEGGLEVLTADPNDFDDGNECTTDACTIEGHEHNARPGAACAGGICDYEGVCRPCNVDACPVATECMMPMCVADGCQLGPRPRGTYCNGDADECDGEGNCVDCVTNGGCGECCVCSPTNVCVEA